MNDTIYWFITVMRKVELNDKGWPNTGAERTWGFYRNKEYALDALHRNFTDMWETIYDYAVLEPYEEGISGYCYDEERIWFKYNRENDSYEEIAEPEGMKHFHGFAFG